jgi:hypothetical protein
MGNIANSGNRKAATVFIVENPFKDALIRGCAIGAPFNVSSESTYITSERQRETFYGEIGKNFRGIIRLL